MWYNSLRKEGRNREGILNEENKGKIKVESKRNSLRRSFSLSMIKSFSRSTLHAYNTSYYSATYLLPSSLSYSIHYKQVQYHSIYRSTTSTKRAITFLPLKRTLAPTFCWIEPVHQPIDVLEFYSNNFKKF